MYPRVKIPVNQFVLGNVFKISNKITIFYMANLPYESENIIFGWQFNKPSLFINIGGLWPTREEGENNFYFRSFGHDDVFRLSKKYTLEKIRENGFEVPYNFIRNANLTIGIWAYSVDTLFTSMLRFKIMMPSTYKGDAERLEWRVIEIAHIRSDLKVKCDPLQL